MRFATHHGLLLLGTGDGGHPWRLLDFAWDNRIAGGGDETGDLQGPCRKTQAAKLGRAIPENEREEMEFLFSTAIADV